MAAGGREESLFGTGREEDLPKDQSLSQDRCARFMEPFCWFREQENVRQLALSWDLNNGEKPEAAIQLLLKSRDLKAACGFLEAKAGGNAPEIEKRQMIGGIVAPVIRRFSFSSEILEHELVEFIKNVIFCNIPWHFCPCVVFSDFCIETKSMVKLIHIEFYKIFIKKVFYRFADLQFYRFTGVR